MERNEEIMKDIENKGKVDLKDFKNKTPLEHMQWKAIASKRGLAGVFKFAQEKYGDVSSYKNRDKNSNNKYKGAMLRHMFAIMSGEDIDPESKLPHLAHLLWCVATLLEFYIEDEN